MGNLSASSTFLLWEGSLMNSVASPLSSIQSYTILKAYSILVYLVLKNRMLHIAWDVYMHID